VYLVARGFSWRLVFYVGGINWVSLEGVGSSMGQYSKAWGGVFLVTR
jgi:hypothetical protein